MSFVYPYFFWALLSLAIPIIIHLFNFRKTIRIYFSDTRFLKQVKEETTQKRKLKQYLVLASRLLFLFFLVVAFTQPFLPAKEQLANQQNVVIYLDNSFSMSTPVAEKTRALDEAIRMAQGIIDLFPSDARYQLITNEFASFSNSYKSKEQISDLLAQVRLSGISRSASEVLSHNKDRNVTFFWISDFQKSTFGNSASADSTWQVQLVHLNLEKRSNIFVDSVNLDNPFAISGEKNSITVKVRNGSKIAVNGLSAKFLINGLQSGTASVDVEANNTAIIKFDIASKLKKWSKGQIVLNDFPISFDNEFFFTLNFNSKLNVIEIKSSPGATYIEKVFGNRQIFSFQSFTISNLNYSLLASAHLVVINGINRPDDSFIEAIKSYKDQLGSMLLIPGTDPDVVSYQKLTGLPIAKAPASELSELGALDFQNPFFANVFEEKNSNLSLPQAVKLITWGQDRSALLQFKNGDSYLSQFGKIFVLASPLDKKYTDFFNQALFVPVMYRIAATGKKAEQPLYYSLSAPSLEAAADSLQGDEPVTLVGAQELIPSQRALQGKLQLELPKYALSPGFYNVTHRKDTLGVVAFNLDKQESLLEQLKPEEAKQAFGGSKSISIFKSASADAFNAEVKEKYLGKPLWKYAILLSLIFLLVEVLLIRFLK